MKKLATGKIKIKDCVARQRLSKRFYGPLTYTQKVSRPIHNPSDPYSYIFVLNSLRWLLNLSNFFKDLLEMVLKPAATLHCNCIRMSLTILVSRIEKT